VEATQDRGNPGVVEVDDINPRFSPSPILDNPAKAATKPTLLLREVLSGYAKKVGIAKVVIKTRRAPRRGEAPGARALVSKSLHSPGKSSTPTNSRSGEVKLAQKGAAWRASCPKKHDGKMEAESSKDDYREAVMT